MVMKMDKKEKAASNGGISFAGLLTIVFVVLKLCGVISWSWWWVVSPLLISMGIYIVALIVLMVIAWRTGYFEE